ncbi:hypothetical protein THRCLA_20859 [Thraustotheca clavata]|uniref:Uncharacterized protein n=1 Tax=Thraustotheca clavata TaxID=74557 RepID=A0A1W0A2S7_9STRA|nr:hypothetical protein THRCLA_20859 [Thraustotheca clavata]
MTSTINIDFTKEEYEILELLRGSPKENQNAKRQRVAMLAAKRTQRYRRKVHEEVRDLRQQVKDLQMKHDKFLTMTAFDGKWKKIAKLEKKRWLNAVNENNRLKQLIKDQLCFANIISASGTSLSFKMKEEWQCLKLAADPKIRIAAIHAIADREYKVMESVFINLGIIDEDHVCERVLENPMHSGGINIHLGASQRVAAPFSIVVNAMWDLICTTPRPKMTFPYQYGLIEVIDESTLYLNWTYKHLVCDFQFRLVVKRYFEPNKRFVIVTRTILEDEVIPLDKNMKICNDTSWMEVNAASKDQVILRYGSKCCEDDTSSKAMTLSIYKELQNSWSQIFQERINSQLNNPIM